MERWEMPPPPPPRHRRDNPSFSSSLLDAICRSIDDESNPAGAQRQKPVAVSERSAVTRHHRFSTSMSSDSSYFSSSSDADSARVRPVRPKPARVGPTLTRSSPIRSYPPPEPKKSSASTKKNLRDLKKSTSPSSPGAKLAGFLNSLFAASSHKKPKFSAADDPSPSPSNCSSASSYSRSCLSKTPSTRGSAGSRRSAARSVRFCPVGVVVGEDCRPCGEKYVFSAEAASAAERERERRKKMVEALMKGFEMEEDDDVSGDESDDGSDDLFELENLAGLSDGRFGDELPVYGTTDLGMNCAIAKGLVV